MKFYHVSNNPNLDGKVIHPRVPLSRMNNEERSIKRICVSASINGCLTDSNRYDIGEILDVYTCETTHFIQPTDKEVIDAPLTGEVWIMEPVEFKWFMRIAITDIFESQFEGVNNYFYAFEQEI